MKILHRLLSLSTLALLLCNHAVAQDERGSSKLVIIQATVDLTTNTLAIYGESFLGDKIERRTPSAFLGRTLLKASGVSSTLISAQLPANLLPGTYLLIVTNGPGTDHFLARLNATMGKKIDRISDEALKKLETYEWPGNVRELENAMERAFILETSSELSAQHFQESVSTSSRMRLPAEFPEDGFHLESYVENLQKGFLEEALRRTNGVQVKAAELLRMTYRSFRHYMQKYNIPS